MAFAVCSDSEEGAKGGHLGEGKGEVVVEMKKEGGETVLVLIPTCFLDPAYIRRENSARTEESITHWKRVRPDASTILCGYLHPLLLDVISAHITKHAADLEEKAQR